MNLQDLKSQLDSYWPTNFKSYYGISLVTMYKVFPPWRVGNRGKARDKFPDDWRTLLERRDEFYTITGLKKSNREDNLKKHHERKIKAKEFVEEYRNKDIISPTYTWPFLQFMNRF